MFNKYENDKVFQTLVDVLRWGKKDRVGRFIHASQNSKNGTVTFRGIYNKDLPEEKWTLSLPEMKNSSYLEDHPRLQRFLYGTSASNITHHLVQILGSQFNKDEFTSLESQYYSSLRSDLKDVYDEVKFF